MRQAYAVHRFEIFSELFVKKRNLFLPHVYLYNSRAAFQLIGLQSIAGVSRVRTVEAPRYLPNLH